MRTVLLIEDEPGLALTIGDRLSAEGFQVEHRGDGESGEAAAMAQAYDLILLDVMLPRKGGFDVCRDLRKAGVDTPILMLTARGQLLDRVVGLEIGADDYLTKPFEFAELVARIGAILRRVQRSVSPQSPSQVRFGGVTANFAAGTVEREGEPIALSAREFQLLQYLVEHPGRIIPREELLKEVWGYAAFTNTRTVDVHVTWLRQKVEANPKLPDHIQTIRGLGYKFNL
jgi:DNA-binding response OmpR family regulator